MRCAARWRHLAIAAAALTASCYGGTEPRKIAPTPVVMPLDDTARRELAPIALDRISVNIPRGTQVGVSYYEWGVCGGFGHGPIYWRSSRFLLDDVEFKDVFFKEMDNQNFRVVGDPNKLFERRDERADYAVGAKITKIELSICDRVEPWHFRPLGRQRGEGSMVVDWEIFSHLERRVVHRTRTSGYAKLTDEMPGGSALILQNAFAAAAANLASDQQLIGLLRQARVETVADSTMPSLRIARVAPFAGPISKNMRAVQAAAVTIDLGNGHGSGFFITSRGHVLTNHHVVGNAEQVTVALSTGTRLPARVLRSDRFRDVALVKVEADGITPLPIRLQPVSVGEEVYAVGTPLERKLATTVTRGIVSAIREPTRHEPGYIQADVGIQRGNSGGPLVDAAGNIVGISVAGYTRGSAPLSGLNLFIPIEEALAKLGIEMTAGATSAR